MVIASIVFFIKETYAEYRKHLNLSSELKVTKSFKSVFLNLCVTTQIWVTKLFWVNHKTIICMMILWHIGFLISLKISSVTFITMIYVVYFTSIFIFDLGVMRQNHWPIPGCSSNTIRERSEGQWRIGEATAILIMLVANVADRIMDTTLSSTQSESVRFYSVLVWTTSTLHVTR